MILLIYIMKSMAISAIGYAYYRFVLRNQAFHQFNRFYLVAMVLLSVTLPLMHISLPEIGGRQTGNLVSQLTQLTHWEWEPTFTIYAQQGHPASGLAWPAVLVLVYVAGAFQQGLLLYRSLWYIRRTLQGSQPVIYQGRTLYLTEDPNAPFSFFDLIF